MQSVAVLIVGDEILTGEIPDENGPRIVRRLARDGVRVARMVVAPDEEPTIVEELTRLRAVADAVVMSGGLGPTHDDKTRAAVATTLGVDLEPHPEAEERIRGYYGDRVTEAELSMAQFPKGARLVSGVKTGTFGFEVGQVYALPGVPFLFRDLLDGIAPEFQAAPLHRVELVTNLREGEIAPRLADLQGQTDIAIGSYPVCDDDGCWHVRVVLRGTDPDQIDALARDLGERLS